MVRKIVNAKVIALIKAYLLFNKGKACTADEIAEWINTGGFGLNQYSLHPKTVSYHVNGARYNNHSTLYDVKVEKIGGVNHFYL